MGKKISKRIKKLLEDIKKFKSAYGFERVILFGSFARGDFKKESDVDLILVDKRFSSKNVFERGKGLWIKWHVEQKLRYPVDFICYSPEEFERLKKKVSLVSEALKEGIEIE